MSGLLVESTCITDGGPGGRSSPKGSLCRTTVTVGPLAIVLKQGKCKASEIDIYIVPGRADRDIPANLVEGTPTSPLAYFSRGSVITGCIRYMKCSQWCLF